MKILFSILLCITITIASKSHHSNEESEEHKSGYGVLDQSSDFGHDKESLDSESRHKADANLFEHSKNHESGNRAADSGLKKHIDEASNRGRGRFYLTGLTKSNVEKYFSGGGYDYFHRS